MSIFKIKFLLLLTISTKIFGCGNYCCFRTEKRKNANTCSQAVGMAIGCTSGLAAAVASGVMLKLKFGLQVAAIFGGAFGGCCLGIALPCGFLLCYYGRKDRNDIFYAINTDNQKSFKNNLDKPDILNIADSYGLTPLDFILIDHRFEMIKLIDLDKLKLATIDRAAETIFEIESKHKITNLKSRRELNQIRAKFFKTILEKELNNLPIDLIQMILDYKPEILNYNQKIEIVIDQMSHEV